MVKDGLNQRREIHSARQHAEAIEADGAAIDSDHLQRVVSAQGKQLVATLAAFVGTHECLF